MLKKKKTGPPFEPAPEGAGSKGGPALRTGSRRRRFEGRLGKEERRPIPEAFKKL